jgi:signal transduction histidine kinase
MDYPDHGMLTEDLKHIEGAALHCSEIVKNLLTFARKSGASTREPVEVPELVNQILKLIGHQFILYNILVRQEFGPDFPRLLLNRTQFQQVLINLLINAQQAMSKKGEVVIRGRTLPTREPVIEIEDQGGGIPAAIRDRIFDPFFTTKEEGKGTGLGLSVSYRIVQEHGGRIEVESEEGKGTRMRLVFPPELVTTEKSESRREA